MNCKAWVSLVTVSIALWGSGVNKVSAAAYLAYTNVQVNFALTNWAGATNLDRPFFISTGDSIAAGYREPPGSVPTPTPDQVGILLSRPDWRGTNIAVPGWLMYQIFPETTNNLWRRKPRLLHMGSPANDAVSFVNFPTTMWESMLATNDRIVAVCRSNGTSLLFMEFIPRSADYKPVSDDWNAKLAIWAARSTNSDVVTVVKAYDFFKDPLNEPQMQSQYTSDLLHNNAFGHTNYCLLLTTGVVASLCHTSATPSRADVGAAYDLSKAGDSVITPAGTATWSSTLTWTNAVGWYCAGSNATIFQVDGAVPIVDFDMSYARGKTFVWEDFRLDQGTSPGSAAWFYVRDCNTNGNFFIAADYWVNGSTAPAPFILGAKCVLARYRHDITNSIGVYIYHENWGGKLYSSGSFSEAVNWGSEDFAMMEDFDIYGTGVSYAYTDAYRGARFALRHGTSRRRWFEAHGTESGFVRGARAIESYFVRFIGDGVQTYGHNIRSGTLITFSNTIENASTAENYAHIDAYRKTVLAAPWGGATGDSLIDDNDPTIHDSGTATSGGTRSMTDTSKTWDVNEWVGYTLTRMTPLVAGTTLYTDFRHGFITANTVDTITVAVNISGEFLNQVYATGDTYQIRKVNQIFDQPGAGTDTVEMVYRKNSALSVSANVASATLASHGFITGDFIIVGGLIIGAAEPTVIAEVTVQSSSAYTFPLTTPNGTASVQYEGYVLKVPAYDQTLDPSYEWGSTKEAGADVDFGNNASPIIAENTHYYNDTQKPGYSPFTYPHPRLLGLVSVGAEPAPPAGEGPTGSGSVPITPQVRLFR
jgi:hypothetical protein